MSAHDQAADRPFAGPSSAGDPVAAGLAELARTLPRRPSPQDVMNTLVEHAVAVVEGAQHGSISLVRRGRVVSAAGTDAVGAAFDALQDQLGQGPCLDAVRDHPVVRVNDLSRETRWPELCRRAPQHLGVRSMLCFQLFVHGDTSGGLTLLADHPDAFTARSQALGEPFAAHAAVALAGAQEMDGVALALSERDVIGQAKGVLMERFSISADQAFAMLSRISRDRNVRLHEMATQLTRPRGAAHG